MIGDSPEGLELTDEELELCRTALLAWFDDHDTGSNGTDWAEELALTAKIGEYLENKRPVYGPPVPRKQSYYDKAPEVSTVRDQKWRWVPGESVPDGQTEGRLGT